MYDYDPEVELSAHCSGFLSIQSQRRLITACQRDRNSASTPHERFFSRRHGSGHRSDADRGLPQDVALTEARAVRALNRAVQELALVDIRRRHPDADEREQALRLASRWIEPELMLRAFGWDVRKVGY